VPRYTDAARAAPVSEPGLTTARSQPFVRAGVRTGKLPCSPHKVVGCVGSILRGQLRASGDCLRLAAVSGAHALWLLSTLP
jgi:hypothetical protein